MGNLGDPQTLFIRFEQASLADAQRYASTLEKALEEVEDLQIRRKFSRPRNKFR